MIHELLEICSMAMEFSLKMAKLQKKRREVLLHSTTITRVQLTNSLRPFAPITAGLDLLIRKLTYTSHWSQKDYFRPENPKMVLLVLIICRRKPHLSVRTSPSL
ncbi:hypothetical protein RHGRI_035124 [Rhododendron griersonianum]|nr:hypothetical protein RHGRI_035124 [Rhododendron griersonianum]